MLRKNQNDTREAVQLRRPWSRPDSLGRWPMANSGTRRLLLNVFTHGWRYSSRSDCQDVRAPRRVMGRRPARRSTPATAVVRPERGVRPVISTFITRPSRSAIGRRCEVDAAPPLQVARRARAASSHHGAKSAVVLRGQRVPVAGGLIPGYDNTELMSWRSRVDGT